MNSQKSITTAIISKHKVLLLKRGRGAPWHPNKYCLPGGGVDKNESLISAAIRETMEETNITLSREMLRRFIISYRNNSKQIIYAAKIDDPIVVLNYEHSDYVWLDYNSCWKYYTKKLFVPGLITKLSTINNRGYF